MKLAKGQCSVKNIGGIMVLVLYTLNGDALPRFVKISRRVSEFLSRHDFHGEIFKEA